MSHEFRHSVLEIQQWANQNSLWSAFKETKCDVIYVWGTVSFQCFRKILQMLHTPVPTQHPLLTALLPWRFLTHAQMCQCETTGQKGVQNFHIYVKTVGSNNIRGLPGWGNWPGWSGPEEHFPSTSLESPWLSCQNHKASLSSRPHSYSYELCCLLLGVLRSASVSVCHVSWPHVGWWLHSGCLVILCPCRVRDW